MKIGVNTRLLLPGRLEGIGTFTHETLKRITLAHPQHDFYFFFDRPFDEQFVYGPNVHPVVVGPQARHPFLWYLFFEHGIASTLQKHQCDLFLSPDGWLSLSTHVPSVNVIHDLNFVHHPEYIKWLVRSYYKYFFPRFARKAARIATVSEFSRSDIAANYGIDPNKIDVVYNGAGSQFVPVDEAEKLRARTRYTSGDPYFLFVGLLHERKNIANLLRAFDEYKGHHPSRIKLLVVGERKWWTHEMQSAFDAMEYGTEVVFTGRLPEKELPHVMASALALMYVSVFEGFGIPMLEAMHCDVPVIASTTSSMPEIAGNAALLANPFSVNEIAHAMTTIASDETMRATLIENGRQRRQFFGWDATAEKLWNCIEKAMPA